MGVRPDAEARVEGNQNPDDGQGPLAPDKPNVGASPAACPVIGLGASAGGLEAFQIFLNAAAAAASLAYVLVQHPNHESMLA